MIYAYLVTAPDVFVNILKLDKSNFLYLLTIMVTAVVLGSLVCSKLSHLIAYKHLVNFSMFCTLISGILCIYAFKKLTDLELSMALTAILSLTFIGISFNVPSLTPILHYHSRYCFICNGLYAKIGIASITTAIMSQINLGSEFTLSFAFVILPLIGLTIFLPYSCYFSRNKALTLS